MTSLAGRTNRVTALFEVELSLLAALVYGKFEYFELPNFSLTVSATIGGFIVSEEEALQYRSAISSVLEEHGLEWIFQQANERITLGKPVSKHLTEAEFAHEVGDRQPHRKTRRAEEFYGTETFNEVEQLEILLDAVEQGLVTPFRMQEGMVENLHEDLESIRFVADDVTDETHSFSAKDLQPLRENSSRLLDALTNIRKQTYAS